jgi:hypothetical protein
MESFGAELLASIGILWSTGEYQSVLEGRSPA